MAMTCAACAGEVSGDVVHANYFACREVYAGPKLWLRTDLDAPGMGMGVAGATIPVVRPEAYSLSNGGRAQAEECDGDRTGGMLSFLTTLRNSS